MHFTLTLILSFFIITGCTSTPNKPLNLHSVTDTQKQKITATDGTPLLAYMNSEMNRDSDTKNELIVDSIKEISVNFDTNSVSIKENEKASLSSLFQNLQKVTSKNQIFEVIGYADKTGQFDYNMQLSKQRALNVKKFLISKGIPEKNIKTIGAGEVDTHQLSEARAVKISAKRFM